MKNIKHPRGWRIGQTLVNFIRYANNRGYSVEPSLGKDIFYISDEDFEKLYKEFLKK